MTDVRLNKVVFRELAISVFDSHPAKLSVSSYSQQVTWIALSAIPVKQTTMDYGDYNKLTTINQFSYIIVRVKDN